MYCDVHCNDKQQPVVKRKKYRVLYGTTHERLQQSIGFKWCKTSKTISESIRHRAAFRIQKKKYLKTQLTSDQSFRVQ